MKDWGDSDAGVAVPEDEVDTNTSPKIGSMWMLRGTHAELSGRW